ncbi:hypothetical protein [Corynebacterium freneyi]|uniref:hypothetical protein n=1 Tax=Corynebacterium freneyi TaxID=134034 RepID=UPI00055973D8|nr:hypothetical protein [Corynebacterium freneyi]
MSRKQRKYEKEIRARKAAEAKVEAEEKAKAERKEAARQRAKAEEQRRAALTPEERAAEDKRNGIIGLIFVAIVAVVILVSCDFGGGDDASDPTPANETTTTEEDTFEVTEIEARTQCQDLVEQRLKAPKTADFPWLDGEWKYTPVDGGYKVESYVDAENSFGAQVRSHFGCTVTKLDESRVNRTLDYFE